MNTIALFTQQMLTGGIENALINFVKILPKEKYKVIVYLMSYIGEFIQKAEEVCDLRVIPMDEKLRDSIPCGGIRVAVKNQMREKRYINALKMSVAYTIGNHKFSELNVDFDKIPKLNEEVDIAICYQLHSPFLVRYIAEKVSAKKKIGWMHNDFATTQYDIRALKEYLDQYDYFFGNAKQIVKEFEDLMPEYKNKVEVIHSVLDWKYMTMQAAKEKADEFDKSGIVLNMLTIARLENQKAIDWAVEACALLLKENHPAFKWFIIGDGSERSKIEKMIQEYKIENNFILLGSRTNPYPYYSQCDVYIQTSRHEGYATTITEALMFLKPIVTTNVSGVSEQLMDGITGIVTDFSPDDIAKGIQKVFDETTRLKIQKALISRKDEAEDAVAIFEHAIGNKQEE